MTEQTVERKLTKALYEFSFGKLTEEQAKDKAKEVAPKIDLNNEVLQHKGINWYAMQLLEAMGLKPNISDLRGLMLK